MLKLRTESIAMVAHEINRAYCEALGDHSQLPWDEAPEWQRKSCIDGVEFHMVNPNADPAASHANWIAEKEQAGWKWGPAKNAETKEHPCFMPYENLPKEQQVKDHLFRAIVALLKS